MYTPRYYQVEANDRAWYFLGEHSGNPLIVLPTGAGKSLVIAMLCRQAIEFGGRVIVLQHRKELIQQNTDKIRALLPDVPIGIYSAGLKSRDTQHAVVCAGIQSIYKRAAEIGERHLIIIDEAHLVSSNDETMYGQFIIDVLGASPKARVIGLTATPYRTGEGPICGGRNLFRRICYEAQTGTLITEGFLCPITNKAADATVSTDSLAIKGGEFVDQDMQRLFGLDENVRSACIELADKCRDRRSVLIFASGVPHAEAVAKALRLITKEEVAVVTGMTFPMERAEYLRRFREQSLRYLVNCDVLTTGFDAPCIDAIAVLRATLSPGLFAQMIGRGLRRHDEKGDTLVLDFGGNIKRHGSLDDPNYGRGSEASGRQRAAAEKNGRGKQCPSCSMDIAVGLSVCPECGFEFPVKARHGSTSDTESSVTGDTTPEEWVVESVSWVKHMKKNSPDSPPSLRMNYVVKPFSGGFIPKVINVWVCFEHLGFARTKACLWWQARSIAEIPETVDDAINLLNRGAARMPTQLVTVPDGKYTRISSVEFNDEIPDEWLDEEASVDSFGYGEELPF